MLHHTIRLANTASAPSGVRAIAYQRLDQLETWLNDQAKRSGSEDVRAHFNYAARRIERFFDDPGEFDSYEPVRAPAGSPVGNGYGNFGCDWD